MLSKYRMQLKHDLEKVGFSTKSLDRAESAMKAALNNLSYSDLTDPCVHISNIGKMVESNQPMEEFSSYVFTLGSVWILTNDSLIEIRNFTNEHIFDVDELSTSIVCYQRRIYRRVSITGNNQLNFNDFSELKIDISAGTANLPTYGGEFYAFGKTNIENLLNFYEQI